ncbi:MAG: hypothetical protein Homavirus5_4 [Homavirus sp.]|uniref:Uncharacterized protein n=1 Tax=Homavirus sp. TaxID=2487769 RepID=A0A3G5A4N7_9VIRU|nr:MAG: hypothetical protein Homavirus5_4 [Homavirus sp.]
MIEEKINYMIDSFDMYNIVFVKTKNNYMIFIKNFNTLNRLRLKTPPMFTPFGIEKYNYKDIVNLEFHELKKNNDMYNFWSYLQQLDKFFINIKYENFTTKLNNKIPEEIINGIKTKTYISCIRPRDGDFNPLLRTHIKKNKNTIQSVFYDESNTILNPNNIKSKIGNFTIELGFLWITDTQYGITWYINGGRFS